jgi:L-threonylcarbamoyladenylate synthase
MNLIDCNSFIEPNLYHKQGAHSILGSDRNVIEKILEPCIQTLNRSGVIVYPTDTIYGLGVNAGDTEAVAKIPDLKNRTPDMPISVAVADYEMITRIACTSSIVRKIYNEFLPGGLTLILDINPKAQPGLSPLLSSKTGKIGVRVPNHNLTLALIKRYGKPITATSANLHGEPVPVAITTAVEQLGGGVDIYIDCGATKTSEASTILEISGSNINIIREGVISRTTLASKLEVPIDGE